MAQNPIKTEKIERRNTKIIAHRGLSGIECENTVASFIAAANRDYYGIETDVHVTSDGKYIIIHDDETGRVSNDNLSVEKSKYNDLREIVLNDKDGEKRADLHLPSLCEYLKICARYEKTGVLEFKNPFCREDIIKIINTVNEIYTSDKMIFISFCYENLEIAREILPNAQIQWLCACEVNDVLVEKLKKHNFGVDIEYHCLTKENTEYLHKNGITINCWTCDDKTDAENLTLWGVDFITTNRLQ